MKLLSVLVKCWMKRGQQRRVRTPGQQRWHHLFGAYNWRTDEVIYMTAANKNTASFCQFIDQLMNTIEGERPVVLVLDNASYHHSRASEAMLACFEDRSITYWLPPYCSDLNPIERFWKHLKEKACSNRLFKQIKDVVDSVTQVLEIQNDRLNESRFVYSKT